MSAHLHGRPLLRASAGRRCCSLAILAHVCLILCRFNAAQAEILPDEVVVLANADSPESLQVANKYLQARKVPQRNLIALPLTTEETISRKSYQTQLTAPLREELRKRGIAAKAKVLLSVYGVPLKVAAPEATEEERQIVLDAAIKQRTVRAALSNDLSSLQAIAGGEKSDADTSSLNDEQLVQTITAEIQNASRRLEGVDSPPQREAETKKLLEMVGRLGGIRALVNVLKPQPGSANEKQAAAHLAAMRKELSDGQNMLLVLSQSPSAENRSRAYKLTERLFGTAGILARASAELAAKKQESADASVDSELTLLWVPEDQYPVAGRLLNPYFYQLPESSLAAAPPVIMTSRLDAPTAQHAARLVRDAVAAEQTGLSGRAYVDARGLKFAGSDVFSIWDQNLRDFGWLVRGETDYKVYIDNNDALLDEAPDTAIYAGWYRLRNYHDVFSFEPGSLGYHIASEEAVSVRVASEKGWCKNMLEKGVAVTVGATAEPYLDSFPQPLQFFGLMFTGKYSLVEAYFLTIKFIGWRMVLFGDPLYNPWRGSRAVALPPEDLKLSDQNGKLLPALPPAPGSRPRPDPAARFEEMKNRQRQMRENYQSKIDLYFTPHAAKAHDGTTGK